MTPSIMRDSIYTRYDLSSSEYFRDKDNICEYKIEDNFRLSEMDELVCPSNSYFRLTNQEIDG